MQFVFEGTHEYRPLRFIEGPLSRFDGITMLVGYGDKKNLTRRKLIPTLRKALQFARNNEAKAISFPASEKREKGAFLGKVGSAKPYSRI